MVETILGTRIRERRRQLGVTQAALAKQIGISASYLNLIERNKRRIAGALLRRTAEALTLRPDELDGAAERRLVERLNEIGHLPDVAPLNVETTQTGEFIGRYPGWARALAALARSERAARRTAQSLSDRLSHDPFLGETVHGMLTRVAAIRSAAEILTDYPKIEDDQRQRFHQIVFEESRVLTDVGEALATYLDKSDEDERILTPLDEVESLFEARANHFAELEAAAADLNGLVAHRAPLPRAVAADAIAREHLQDRIAGLIDDEPLIETAAARSRALAALTEYAAGAVLMPMPAFATTATDLDYDIEALAGTYRVGVEAICRRLTALPPESGTPRFGYIKANASGTIIEMLGLRDLALPRYAAACPLWALYRAQQTPEAVIRQLALFPNGVRFVFAARARNTGQPGFGQPRHYVTDMLTMTLEDAASTVYHPSNDAAPEEVGPACRLCPRTACGHRVDDPLTG